MDLHEVDCTYNTNEEDNMAGTPNPDFDAEPWCDETPAQPEVIYVQESTDAGFRPETLSQPNQ